MNAKFLATLVFSRTWTESLWTRTRTPWTRTRVLWSRTWWTRLPHWISSALISLLQDGIWSVERSQGQGIPLHLCANWHYKSRTEDRRMLKSRGNVPCSNRQNLSTNVVYYVSTCVLHKPGSQLCIVYVLKCVVCEKWQPQLSVSTKAVWWICDSDSNVKFCRTCFAYL